MNVRALLAVAILLLCLPAGALGDDSVLPDRRKPQFSTEQGYYVFPMPYSIPGVGAGAGVLGIGMNLGGSYTDVFGFVLGGGITGEGLGVSDIHIIPRTLILDLTGINFEKATVTSFKERGMNTDKHDFSFLQFDNYRFGGARLTATFDDRHYEVYGGAYKIGSELEKVLDQNKNTILDVQNPAMWRTNVYGFGVRGDLTDDYNDPRRGFRIDIGRWWSPPSRSSSPDFYRMEYNATAYLPLGKRSTWAFNYFRSDAVVVRQGETSRAAVEQQQGLNCGDPALTPRQQADCNSVIDNIIAGNRYGTASGLGGTSRLRAYPNDRFSGAHTVFYGSELRWTLTEEARPFDIFVAKDVRTSLQVAAFYELGSVADRRQDLGDIYRPSYGAGFRMVTASGVVLRADFATGREGIETTIIMGYPWESF